MRAIVMSVSEPLHDLVELSQYAGSSILLVQGAGGNTSVKSSDGSRMWIKASGLNLSELTAESGGIELDLTKINNDAYFASLAQLPPDVAHTRAIETVQAAAINPGKWRPSLETLFHVVLDTHVLHTHSVYANAYTCLQGGRTAIQQVLPMQHAWIPYITPGYALGIAVRNAARRTPGLRHILLENHGPITAGSTVAEAIAATQAINDAARAYFGGIPADALDLIEPGATLRDAGSLLQAAMPKRKVRISRLKILRDASPEAEQWLTAGPLIPDDVVYFGRTIHTVDRLEEIARVAEAAIGGSLAMVVRGHGVVMAGPNERFVEAMEEGLAAHALVRLLIHRRGEPQLLPAAAVDVLANMEAEKHRQAMLAR